MIRRNYVNLSPTSPKFLDAKYRNGMFLPLVAGTQADVETLCDEESGVCLDGDEGVF